MVHWFDLNADLDLWGFWPGLRKGSRLFTVAKDYCIMWRLGADSPGLYANRPPPLNLSFRFDRVEELQVVNWERYELRLLYTIYTV